MTKSQILTLTGFVLLGAVVAWQFTVIRDLQAASSAQSGANADQAPPETLISTTPDQAQATSRADGKSGAGASGPSHRSRDPQREARFRERREMDRKQLLDAKLLALTTKLNLTADQQAVIRAALEKGTADRDAVREAGEVRRREGNRDSEETRRADMSKIAAADAAQEQAIASGLSADQLAAYTEYQTEQKQTTIENRANQQLGDLLTRFSLTEDQKDAAFQFFARQEEENGFDPDKVAAMGGDFMTLFDQRQKNELEALKQILTPAQFELYRTQQEQRSTAFRRMIPGAPQGSP